MNELAERTLRFALEEGRPVIVCYVGKSGEISQRRVYVRKMEGGRLTVYDVKKRAPRVLSADGVLSAVMAEQ